MDITDILAPLELACRYCLEKPTNQCHYEVLRDTMHATFRRAIELGVEIRFLYRNPVFQQAWELFTTPAAQHRSNVVYLTGRLPSF